MPAMTVSRIAIERSIARKKSIPKLTLDKSLEDNPLLKDERTEDSPN